MQYQVKLKDEWLQIKAEDYDFDGEMVLFTGRGERIIAIVRYSSIEVIWETPNDSAIQQPNP